MRRLVFLIFSIALTLPCFATLPAQKHEVKVEYFPASTTLQGNLLKVRRFGPPGFGEAPATDAKVSMIVLVLKSPVTAVPAVGVNAGKASDLDVVSGVSEIRLYFDGDDGRRLEAHAEKMIGKTVTIKGTLHEAVAPMDFTELTMSVTAVKGP